MISCVVPNFFKSYSELPRHIQKKAGELFEKFSENPFLPGLNYEKLASCDQHLRSLRVDKEYRMIVYVEEDRGIMLYVDKHDDAYDWAKRTVFISLNCVRRRSRIV